VLPASRPPGGGHVPPSAKRLRTTNSTTTARRNNPHRQAYMLQEVTISAAIAWRELPLRQAPPAPDPHYFSRYRLADFAMPPGAT